MSAENIVITRVKVELPLTRFVFEIGQNTDFFPFAIHVAGVLVDLFELEIQQDEVSEMFEAISILEFGPDDFDQEMKTKLIKLFEILIRYKPDEVKVHVQLNQEPNWREVQDHVIENDAYLIQLLHPLLVKEFDLGTEGVAQNHDLPEPILFDTVCLALYILPYQDFNKVVLSALQGSGSVSALSDFDGDETELLQHTGVVEPTYRYLRQLAFSQLMTPDENSAE